MVCALVGFTSLAMAKDYLYIPCQNHLHVVDCDTDMTIKTLSFNDYIVGSVPSPKGDRLYLNSFHDIYEVDTKSNEIVEIHKFFTDLNRVTIMPDFGVSNDGKYLYLSVSICKKKLNIPRLNVLPPQLVVYDIQNKKLVKNFEIPPCATGVITCKNDPNHVFVFAQDIIKLDLKTGKYEKALGLLHPETGQPGFNSLVIWDNESPGDHGFFVNPAYTAEEMFYILIDRNAGTVKTLKSGDIYFAYSCVLDEQKKYMYGVMDEIYKIDFKTGATVAMDVLDRGTCYALALTKDGKKLYVGPAGNDVSIYDTTTMKRIGLIRTAGDGVVMTRITK